MCILTVFLKNRDFISEMKRSKVTDYAALNYKMRFLIVSKKKNFNYSCADGIEKSVPCEHRFVSLGVSRDANTVGDPRDGLFHPTLMLMRDS